MTDRLPILWIWLEDEAPRLGCGRRRVEVLSRGPRWVRLRSPASGRRVRLARAVFDSLKQTMEEHDAS